jgi:hypothetical protein
MQSGKHTSAYVSIRQHTSAYVSIRQHPSAYVSIRQHTSAYVSIRQHPSASVSIRQHPSAYVSIRQHTSAYVSIRQHTCLPDEYAEWEVQAGKPQLHTLRRLARVSPVSWVLKRRQYVSIAPRSKVPRQRAARQEAREPRGARCAASVCVLLYQESKETEYLASMRRASTPTASSCRSCVSICTFVPVKQAN